MALHTWFYKDKKLYNEREKFYEQLDKHEKNEIFLDDTDILQIIDRIDEIDKLNKTDFHDCFRTTKREASNGEYTLDKIYSKKDCDKWLEENKKTVYWNRTLFDTDKQKKEYRKLGLVCLNKFWDEFSNGVIEFG
jgi:hypothetical protein